MQPRKATNDFKLLGTSFPKCPFTVSAVEKQAAKGRKLGPTNVLSSGNRISRKACNVGADDAVAHFSAF